MRIAMKHPMDDLIAAVSGIFGGGLFIHFAGITWANAWENFGNVLWLGFVALISGAMGMLGKHLAGKYINRKKKNKSHGQ